MNGNSKDSCFIFIFVPSQHIRLGIVELGAHSMEDGPLDIAQDTQAEDHNHSLEADEVNSLGHKHNLEGILVLVYNLVVPRLGQHMVA